MGMKEQNPRFSRGKGVGKIQGTVHPLNGGRPPANETLDAL